MTPRLLKIMEPVSLQQKRSAPAATTPGSQKHKKARTPPHLALGQLVQALAAESSPAASLRKFRSLALRVRREDRVSWQLETHIHQDRSLVIELDQDDYLNIDLAHDPSRLFCMHVDCQARRGEWTWLEASEGITGGRLKRIALRLSRALQLNLLTLEDASAVPLPGAQDDELLMRIFRPILYGLDSSSYYSSDGFQLSPEVDVQAYANAVQSLQDLGAQKIHTELLAGQSALQRRFSQIRRGYLKHQPHCRLQGLALAIDAERRKALAGSPAYAQHALNFAFLFQSVIGGEYDQPLNPLQRDVAAWYDTLYETASYQRRLNI